MQPTATAATDTIASAERLLRYEADIAFRRRARTIVEYLDPRREDRILDAGCGLGFQLALLGRIGQSELHGVDLRTERLQIADEERGSSRAQLVAGDVTRLPYTDASFDKVILSEVLEHLPDDLAALREVHRVMKPAGVLAITVPHEDYPFLWDPPNFLRERLGLGHFTREPWSGIWTDHRRLYTPDKLKAIVLQAGFSVSDVRLETRYSLPFAHHIVYGLGKFLVERNLLGGSVGKRARRSSFWSDHDRLTPSRVLIKAFTAVDRFNEPRYGRGPAVSLCLRAVKDDA